MTDADEFPMRLNDPLWWLMHVGTEAPSRGRAARSGIAALPGFAESLRLLIEVEKYSLSDIAMMLDVSRERIRQLANRLGIERPEGWKVGLHCIRLWDDEANRFRPVSRGVLAQARQVERVARNRANVAAKRRARRAVMVQQALALAARLGREPSWSELFRVYFPNREVQFNQTAAYVLSYWGHRGHGPRFMSQAIAEFRAATGFTGRSPGSPGHLSARKKRTHCLRGHAYVEHGRMDRDQQMQCALCERIRYYVRQGHTPTEATVLAVVPRRKSGRPRVHATVE